MISTNNHTNNHSNTTSNPLATNETKKHFYGVHQRSLFAKDYMKQANGDWKFVERIRSRPNLADTFARFEANEDPELLRLRRDAIWEMAEIENWKNNSSGYRLVPYEAHIRCDGCEDNCESTETWFAVVENSAAELAFQNRTFFQDETVALAHLYEVAQPKAWVAYMTYLGLNG